MRPWWVLVAMLEVVKASALEDAVATSALGMDQHRHWPAPSLAIDTWGTYVILALTVHPCLTQKLGVEMGIRPGASKSSVAVGGPR